MATKKPWGSAWLNWLGEVQQLSNRRDFNDVDPDLKQLGAWFRDGRTPEEVAAELPAPTSA